MLFCKYCKIFKNTYFEEHLRTAPFVNTPLHAPILPTLKIHCSVSFVVQSKFFCCARNISAIFNVSNHSIY